MTYIQTIILGLIEGLTEFLPISSTGHLILAQNVLGVTTTEFTKTFDILIQLSAILAVLILYWKRILSSRKLWIQLIITFLPTGILGLTLYNAVKRYLLNSTEITTIALFIGGLVLLIVDSLPAQNNGTKKVSHLKLKNLLSIGLFQSFSMIPGVSRSAATIVGGMFSGLSRTAAVEFSFLLAIPTMVAASGYDLIKSGFYFTGYQIQLLIIGSAFSFLSAIIAVKAFTSFIEKHNFKIFALYRILLSIIIFFTVIFPF